MAPVRVVSWIFLLALWQLSELERARSVTEWRMIAGVNFLTDSQDLEEII